MIRTPWLAALVSAATLVLVPAPAFPCGDTGGGGGSGGGGGGGGGSGSASSSGGGCHDETRIVGRTECHRHAWWNVSRYPRLRIGMGTSLHVIPLAGMSFEGVASHDESHSYRLVGGTGSGAGVADETTAVTFDVHVALGLSEHTYVGGVASLGGHALGREAKNLTQGPMTLDPQGGLYASVGALAGAMLRPGNWIVRGEAQVGRRFVTLAVESQSGDCVDESFARAGQWQVRPRLAVERWLTPWVTAGASVSTDLLRDGDVSAGVFIDVHLRAYDATRTRR